MYAVLRVLRFVFVSRLLFACVRFALLLGALFILLSEVILQY